MVMTDTVIDDQLPTVQPSTEPLVNNRTAKDFFCATRDEYVGPAGAILSLTASDWDMPHRRRHLESYAKSTNIWKRGAPVDLTGGSSGANESGEGSQSWPSIGSGAALWAHSLRDEYGLITNRAILEKTFTRLRKQHKCTPPVSDILKVYRNIQPTLSDPTLEQLLLKKAVRSMSGVSVITVLTAPGEFSCAFDCAYCPNEPGQPRSYLSTEPAVMRANQNEWDAARQFWDRAGTLHGNGHTVDKLEVLVLGGTWSGYPEDYQETFIRDIFYAANVLPEVLKNVSEGREVAFGLRDRKALQEEQVINEFSQQFHNEHEGLLSWEKVPSLIGLTLETRPDQITPRELHRLRYLGTTRVQMGIQHTDDNILKKIRRQCPIDVTRKALALLKNSCFKVDIHLMPDLPGASPDVDRNMFELVLSSPELQADQWKVYPCEVTPFSSIEEWYTLPESNPNHYSPYADKDDGRILVNVLASMKQAVHPWIRLNRVIRDIPEVTIIGGNKRTNLRQILTGVMDVCGWSCRCMRCREVRDRDTDPLDAVLVVRRYISDHGHVEYFCSFESPDESTIFAFLRLRVPKNTNGAADREVGRLPPPDHRYWLDCDPTSRMDGQTFMDEQMRNKFIQGVNKDKSKEQREARKYLVDTDADRKAHVRDTSFDVFPELSPGIALIRELHVYGQIVATGEQQVTDTDKRAQHRGFGKMLLAVADRLAVESGCYGLAVIAGVGVRGYYRNQGYIYDCLGRFKGDSPHEAYTPEAMNLQNPLETMLEDKYLPQGQFLMKYVRSIDELSELRYRLDLPSSIVIQHYDCETKLPVLDDYDLEKASKDRIGWNKQMNDIIKAKSKLKAKKNLHSIARRDANQASLEEAEPPEFGTPEFEAAYLLSAGRPADASLLGKPIFSHASSNETIVWDRKDSVSTWQSLLNTPFQWLQSSYSAENWEVSTALKTAAVVVGVTGIIIYNRKRLTHNSC
eukprot:GHVH01005258.1.p1 GENE.GHVH01005258.1~~GHVH01005258.1.p1  ORF type:complete len:969 (-),score=140.14 GHVH01005258.1:195-3101(-)